MADQREEVTCSLESEFPLLDSSTVRAIASDYDLSAEGELKSLRSILEDLQVQAMADMNITYDNTDRTQPPDQSPLAVRQSEASVSSYSYFSGDYYEEGVTVPSSNGEGANRDVGFDADEYFDRKTEEEKVEILSTIFRTLDTKEVRFHLRKSQQDVATTMDVLLNLVYIDEDETIVSRKGTDALLYGTAPPKGKKSRGRRRNNQTEPAQGPRPASQPANCWTGSQDGIEFLCSRTGLSKGQATSHWHQSGANLERAIGRLVQADLDRLGCEFPEERTHVNCVLSLTDAFPGIGCETAVSLSRLSGFCQKKAYDLALVLAPMLAGSTSLTGASRRQKVDPSTLQTAYRRITQRELDAEGERIEQARPAPLWISGQSVAAQQFREKEAEARKRLQESARRARSNRLYGGAVAHYASEAHSATSRQADLAYDELEQLVSSIVNQAMASQRANSGKGPVKVDLHGMTVTETLACVERLLDRLGRSEGLGSSSFRGPFLILVTGKGIHSKGAPRLGPQVNHYLLSNGWEFYDLGGEVHVTGIRKR